ncbi:hypothetical protein [Microbulbifer variabilis]|uniref:hypothetical protein n=1 Tax=Microbulbifer variabilis TaxID=266805 RepID=UPI001CFF3C1E|nr:hypothetical protein [Microbulbifer variabilis]
MLLVLTNFIDSLMDFLSAPFVEAFLTATFIGSGAVLKKKVDTKAFKNLWGKFLGESDSEIHVVLPLIRQKTLFSEITNKQSKIPNNVLFLPYDEALGIQLLKDAIEKAYPKRKVIFHDSRNFVGDHKSFICVGGPAVNVVSRDLLLTRKIDAKFKMDFLGRFAVDEVDESLYKTNTLKGSITDDYGFIFFTQNPYHKGSCVCLVFGIWSHGTYSAVQALCQKGKPLKELVRYLKDNKSLFAVTKSTVRGMVTGFPSVEKLRKIEAHCQASADST